MRPTKHNLYWVKFCRTDVYLSSLAFTHQDKQILM